MTRRLRISDLSDFAIPEQPALAPDGSQIVYVLRTQDTDTDRAATALWRVDTQGGEPAQLTRGTADSAPAWSPDGKNVAFLRAKDGPAQLWLLPADGGEPEQLTTLPLGAGRPLWSHDGRKIAFAAPVDLHADDGEDDKARDRRATAPIVTERLDYQADGTGLLRTIRPHLHVLDVATKDTRQVTEGDWHAGQPSWSPEDTRLAFAAATAPDADLDYRAGVHVLDITDPRNRPELVGFDTGIADLATWTADGETLLVTGRAHGANGHTGIYRLPVSGAPADLTDLVGLAEPLDRNVLPGVPGNPGGGPELIDGGAAVLFCVRDRGCAHLYRVGVEGGAPAPVLVGADRVVAGVSVSGSLMAGRLGTATSFGEIVTVDLATGTETMRTDHGANLADVALFIRESREFTISDGTVVQGWLVRDPDRTGPLPLLLDIHGGPHGVWNGAADLMRPYHQELAARGWAVLLLNPRASDGYGEPFYTASAGSWGTGDSNDFLEPIDTLVTEGVADPARLAVTGYSYGGFMTCYLTSHDQRFAAAVAGGVVADLTSFSGTSDAGHPIAMHEIGAFPWQEPDRVAAHSPITAVADVRTPTLILHATDDARTPIGQAQQWYTALRERGVPTQLVLYPGGSHLAVRTGQPSHRIDFNQRLVDWVEHYANGTPSPVDERHWQRRLDTLARRHNVPGAQLGILRLDEEIVTTAHGVLNIDTGVAATTDSLFEIGSISKVWTTTLLMQLVDEGKLDLDAPVIDVLPELRLADPDTTAHLTARHLVTHTSGIDGDVFTDTGRGDDCLERYVAELADAARNHPLGATWSYCNSGFVIAGRIIEKLTGSTWDAALRERLLTPLGLTHTVTLPEEALLYRTAVGHLGDTELTRTPVWGPPRSMGPAGVITSTVADVLTFARMHLTGGLTPDGTRLLSAESAAAMAAKQADLPDKHTLGESWGLGWARYDWHGAIGHDGNTIGQSAFLRIVPDKGVAVALFTNGGNTSDLSVDLFEEIFAEIAQVTVPRPLTPPAEPVEVDLTPWLGSYERASARMEVLADGPTLRITDTGPLAGLLPDPVQEFALVAVEPGLFVVHQPGTQTWAPVLFYTLPDGARCVHHHGRATPKVG